MKKNKLILALVLCFASAFSYGQLVQASLGAGSTANSVKIYLKTNNTTSVTFSTLNFNLAIPSSLAVNPTPTVTAASVGTAPTWQVAAAVIEGGYKNYSIIPSALAPALTASATANVEFEGIEVNFGAGVVPTDIRPVTLPNAGGNSGTVLYYATSPTVNSSGLAGPTGLYFARSGTVIDNQLSYDPITGIGPGTSTAIFSGVVPIRLSGFSAVKKNADAYLTWTVENQDANADHFEIERSFNGTDFKNIGVTGIILNGGSLISYNFTDRNITSLKGTSIIYYRLKSFDKDGSFVYSYVKNIRLNTQTLA